MATIDDLVRQGYPPPEDGESFIHYMARIKNHAQGIGEKSKRRKAPVIEGSEKGSGDSAIPSWLDPYLRQADEDSQFTRDSLQGVMEGTQSIVREEARQQQDRLQKQEQSLASSARGRYDPALAMEARRRSSGVEQAMASGVAEAQSREQLAAREGYANELARSAQMRNYLLNLGLQDRHHGDRMVFERKRLAQQAIDAAQARKLAQAQANRQLWTNIIGGIGTAAAGVLGGPLGAAMVGAGSAAAGAGGGQQAPMPMSYGQAAYGMQQPPPVPQMPPPLPAPPMSYAGGYGFDEPYMGGYGEGPGASGMAPPPAGAPPSSPYDYSGSNYSRRRLGGSDDPSTF